MTVHTTALSATPPAVVPLDTIPAEFARNRVLDSVQTATFLGMSRAHLLRLCRAGKLPQPIKVTERKLGWRWGDLSDFVASRNPETKAA